MTMTSPSSLTPQRAVPIAFEERISALLDDETEAFETRRALDELARDPLLRQRLADFSAVQVVTQAVLQHARRTGSAPADAPARAFPSVSMLADDGFAERVRAALADDHASDGIGVGDDASRPVASRWLTRVAGGGVAATVALVAVGVWTQIEAPGGGVDGLPTAATVSEQAAPVASSVAAAGEGAAAGSPPGRLAENDVQSRFARVLSGELADGQPIRFFESGLTPWTMPWSASGAFSLASPLADPVVQPRWARPAVDPIQGALDHGEAGGEGHGTAPREVGQDDTGAARP